MTSQPAETEAPPADHPAEQDPAVGRMTSAAEDAPYIPAPEFFPPSFHISKRALIIVLITALVVALAGAGVGLWFGVIRTKPTDIVKGYLAALARADAAAALGYGCNPTSGPYLTDAVLARSQQLAPLSVKSLSLNGTSRTTDGLKVSIVLADVTMGKDDRQMDFRVVHKPGLLCMLPTYATVNVTAGTMFIEPGSIPLAAITPLLNGAAVEGNQMHLFPGTYELTTPNTLVVTTLNTFTVAKMSPYSDPDLEPVNIDLFPIIKLADGVPKRLATLVTDELTKCLKETTTHTSCGFGTKTQGDLSVFGGRAGDIDPSSVNWSLADSYGGTMPTPGGWMVTLQPEANNAYYAVGPSFIALYLSARTYSGDPAVRPYFVTPVVDISNPDNPRVVWRQA